jgi:hypothetical protein
MSKVESSLLSDVEFSHAQFKIDAPVQAFCQQKIATLNRMPFCLNLYRLRYQVFQHSFMQA